jgi:hypothetical protein
MGYFTVSQISQNMTQANLLEVMSVESRIQDAQINDLTQQMSQRASESYQSGYEAGKTQMGIAFLHEGTMEDYADGYHAAISQFGPVDPDNITYEDDSLNTMLHEMFYDAVKAGEIELAEMLCEILVDELTFTLEFGKDDVLLQEELLAEED